MPLWRRACSDWLCVGPCTAGGLLQLPQRKAAICQTVLQTAPRGLGVLGQRPSSFFHPPQSLHTVHSLLKRAGIGASGALLAGVSIGAWLDAHAAATLTVAPAAAQQPVGGHAHVGTRSTVAVVASPVRVTHAVPTVALAMAYKQSQDSRPAGEKPTPRQQVTDRPRSPNHTVDWF